MKKIIAMLMACLFVLSFMTAFAESEKTLSIVCTTFPQYDWVRQILGDRVNDVDLTLLLDNGVDLHSYQPTADDIVKIAQSDLFIYVGGESDGWVEDVLATAQNPNLKTVNMLESVEAKEEQAVPGMQAEEGHNHGVADFDDSDVKDRDLTDWTGDWQSVYPYVLDGTLDPVMEKKAESGKKTAEEYKESYIASYETDIEKIHIEGDTIQYTRKEGTSTATYEYEGFYIRHKDDGSKQVRYEYKKASGDADAPTYIVFSDHNISSAEPEHFHLYFGENGFDDLVEEGKHFPTFYPASLTGTEIADEMLEHEETEYDEHVWLSLRNAETLTQTIADALGELDPDNASAYQANATSYIAQLNELDNQYKDAVANGQRTTILFADRFPFRYLADDYGLTYYAAFVGCSAETEASFETIAFLAQKVDELKLPVVLTIEGDNHSIAETVVSSTQEKNQQILVMNSLQSVTEKDIEAGESYLGIMTENLEVLKEALN